MYKYALWSHVADNVAVRSTSKKLQVDKFTQDIICLPTKSRLCCRESKTSMTLPVSFQSTDSSAAYASPLAAARSLLRGTAAVGSMYTMLPPGLLPRSIPLGGVEPPGTAKQMRLPYNRAVCVPRPVLDTAECFTK